MIDISILISSHFLELQLPLIGKSEYLREKLKDGNEVELPPDFPGGAEAFEMMVLFIYYGSSSALLKPSNVAALRCAAEFLQMTEECERLDVYLNRVVLQSWDGAVTVLRTCTSTRTLLPWAEDLLIVSRCIETTAFMACMEILDPERRREQPLVTMTLQAWPWRESMVRDMMSRDAWIGDVVALPLLFFKRVIASLRRQGMKEKYVSPIILLYAHKRVLSGSAEGDTNHLLQGVLDLVEGSSSRVVPVGFYMSLLAASVKAGLRKESLEKLRNQIASLMHLARPKDLLLPKDGIELSVMERIFMDSDSSSPAVAQLWDQYLNRIAADPELGCNRFITLIQALPSSSRHKHDHLYAAINAFFQVLIIGFYSNNNVCELTFCLCLQSHPDLSQEEKGSVCKYLDCQKLSRQVCIEAVRNEVMPLRLMVQALYVQHSNTQQALEESFRETSGSLGGSRPFGLLLQHEEYSSTPQPVSRKDYESTSFRIESLEKELMSLKKSLELQQISNRRKNHQENQVCNKNNSHQFTGCIGIVSFDSQRKYANRILKILQRLTLFGGGGRSRRKTAAHHL